MTTLPTVNRVYVGTAGIIPSYLAGRRMVIRRLLTRGDIRREAHTSASRIAIADVLLRQGLDPTRPDDDEAVTIEVAVLRRGRTGVEWVEVPEWHAKEVR